jgi:hypothetical protein
MMWLMVGWALVTFVDEWLIIHWLALDCVNCSTFHVAIELSQIQKCSILHTLDDRRAIIITEDNTGTS